MWPWISLWMGCAPPEPERDGLSWVPPELRRLEHIESFLDRDGDGFGGLRTTWDRDPSVPRAAVGGDCDDEDPGAHPGAEEICNGLDDDCDPATNDSDLIVPTWMDEDMDGYGPGEPELLPCASFRVAHAGGDCDDADRDVHPGAQEVCDERDNDCDPATREEDLPWSADQDGDGHGVIGQNVGTGCDWPDGYGPPDDCDDDNALIFPSRIDTCDGLDNDCDPSTLEDVVDGRLLYLDADGDGDGAGEPIGEACEPGPGQSHNDDDCVAYNAAFGPSVPEVCDGVDQDCDGLVDDETLELVTSWLDNDGDGFGDPSSALTSCGLSAERILRGGDCDDSDSTIFPGAAETCGAERDCDLRTDPCSRTCLVASSGGDTHLFALDDGAELQVLEACRVDALSLQGTPLALADAKSVHALSPLTCEPSGSSVPLGVPGPIHGDGGEQPPVVIADGWLLWLGVAPDGRTWAGWQWAPAMTPSGGLFELSTDPLAPIDSEGSLQEDRYALDLSVSADALVWVAGDCFVNSWSRHDVLRRELGGSTESSLSWSMEGLPVQAELMPDGQVWIAELDGTELVRVDGQTGVPLGVVPLPSPVSDLLALPDGTLIVADEFTGELVQIDASGAVLRSLGSVPACACTHLSLGPCPAELLGP